MKKKGKIRVICYVDEEKYAAWSDNLRVYHGVQKSGRFSTLTSWNSLLFEKALEKHKKGEMTLDETELEK